MLSSRMTIPSLGGELLRKRLVPLLLCAAASVALAQDERAVLVQRISVAQGLSEMFDVQFAAHAKETRAMVQRLVDQEVAQGRPLNARQTQVVQRFLGRLDSMFSGQAVASEWARHYGRDLSVQELAAILAYYESPVGRKDVLATRQAMATFSQWAAKDANTKTDRAIRQLFADLRAAR